MNPPRSGFAAPPQGGDRQQPGGARPRRPLDVADSCIEGGAWRHGPLRRWLLLLLLLAGALPAAALAQEPPDHPALRCTLQQQILADGAWRLQLRFENTGAEPLELRPGAQLVLYHDAAATDSWTDTARADRLQRSALLLAPGAARSEVLLVEPQAGRTLRCAGRRAAAAALYFYRFEPRPLFRCRLDAVPALPADGCDGR